MQYLSKQKLKAFTKRFLLARADKRGRIRNVPITSKEANQAIERFVSLNRKRKELKPSFINVRVNVLGICLKEKTPLNRWIKVRDFLINRLESQVLNAYPNQDILQDHEVEPSHVLSYLMNPDSFLCWCIKLVVLFNVTDEKVNIPADLYLDFVSGIKYYFPIHRLRRRKLLLKAKTKDGEIIETLIPYNKDNAGLVWGTDITGKFSVTFSILVDQDSKQYQINNELLFQKLCDLYPDYVEKYKLDNTMKPSFLLSKLGTSTDIYSRKERQIKLLESIIGKNEIQELQWKWEAQNVTVIDLRKVADTYFPEIMNDIISISPGSIPLRWKPNNYIFDEDSLRYELIDLYLQRFEPHEREKSLMEQIKDLSIFNLRSFRDLIAKWESDKDIGNIIWMLERLQNHYIKHRKDPKEREKWIEYTRIVKLVQQGFKQMDAYKRISAGDNERTIQKRYLRQREKAKKLGYDINNPEHLEEIKKAWNIFGNENFII